MNLSRRIAAVGLAAVSLSAFATPALAKDINNTVTSIAPGVAPAPDTGGSGGGGRRATCVAVGIDPVTGSTLMSCTTARP
jgi:hypothetical protein